MRRSLRPPSSSVPRPSPLAPRTFPLLALVALALLGGAVTGPRALAAARPAYGGTLRVSFSQPAATLDPVFAATLPERTLSRAVYETLTEFGEAGLPAPALAVNWQSESGGKRWVIRLRSDVRFHNGNSLTALAACASLARAVSQSQSAVAIELRTLQFACTAPASDRLACETNQPAPALAAMLADPALALADLGGSGTGPFRLIRFDAAPLQHARLEAFEAYRRGRPFLDAVEADFGVDARRQRIEFETQRADAIAAPATEPRLPGQAQSSLPVNVLVLSMPAGAGRELPPEARRAIVSAINRDALARLLPPGRADSAPAFLPGWLSGYDFLFVPEAPAPPAAAPLAPREYRLIYDAADPVARLIASRLALDLRPLGAALRLDGVAHAGFAQARASAQYDFCLESASLAPPAGPALAGIVQRYELAPFSFALYKALGEPFGQPPGQLPGMAEAWIEYQYRQEKAALELGRAIPLIHFRDVYNSSRRSRAPISRPAEG